MLGERRMVPAPVGPEPRIFAPDMDVTGSLAVVTGATEGIGRATAFALGRAGARVAICARTEANVHATVRELKAAGIDAIGMPCDVSDPACVDAFAAFVISERGTPQVLVKDAGTGTIVNIASLAGKNGVESETANCASKHAVLGFSKALMLEVRKRGVRVVAVCPGSVATPFAEKGARVRHNRDRVLMAEDVAHAVLATLTASDRAMIS